MRPRSPSAGDDDPGDRGSATLEFVFVGLLLLVPLVYLIIALGQIQAHSLGVESGARHIARTVATSSDRAEARERAERIVRSIAREYSMGSETPTVSFTCAPASSPCPDAGSVLTVRVAVHARLPLAPPILGLDRIATIPVEAAAVQQVSTTWAGR
jgi:Flp pilus assembly protein TadG